MKQPARQSILIPVAAPIAPRGFAGPIAFWSVSVMRDDLFGMANQTWPGLTPYAMFFMVLVSSLGLLAMMFWTAVLVPAKARSRGRWRSEAIAPRTGRTWRAIAPNYGAPKRPYLVKRAAPATPRNGEATLVRADGEVRKSLPVAAPSAEIRLQNKTKPVSEYAGDIEKAIAGFRAAHAMLAERENGASAGGEMR
jgi:hypothetical protein